MSPRSVQQAARVRGNGEAYRSPNHWQFGLRAKKDDACTHRFTFISLLTDTQLCWLPRRIHAWRDMWSARVPGLLYPEVEGITILRNDKKFLPNDTTRYFRTEWSTESLWEPQILHLCWRQQPDWHELYVHIFKQQDNHCTYNVTFRCVRVTIGAIEKH
jgi:hypothetical protein